MFEETFKSALFSNYFVLENLTELYEKQLICRYLDSNYSFFCHEISALFFLLYLVSENPS